MYPGVDSKIYPGVDPRSSQNLPLPPRIYPLFRDLLKCLWIPESTLPFQEYTPFFNKFICATLPESTPPSQNIPPFSTTICDPSSIYPSLPEYDAPILISTTVCDPSKIYTPVSTPPSQNMTLLSSFQQLYATLPESIPRGYSSGSTPG